MDKHELLRLFDDLDVRDKILAIISGVEVPIAENDKSLAEKKLAALEAEILLLKEQLLASDAEKNSAKQRATDAEQDNRRLTAELGSTVEERNSANQRTKEVERQLENLRDDNAQLENSLQQVNDNKRQLEDMRFDNAQLEDSLARAKRRIKELEQQIQTSQYINLRLENELSQTKQSSRSLQGKLEEWQRTFTREQRRAKDLQCDLDAAQIKISELEAQLQDRFARGWELYQKYQSIGSHARQLLQGVFPRDNFMSFICGGAQVDSLETLWDVLRECVMNNRQQDADILCEVFEYCLELVNSSKAQASYSILPVNVGDRFDMDVHSEAPGSRAQGKVSVVYLQGYRNDYNRRVIKKSIVQVS